jgi:alpha-L-arabinofuranosidase
MKQLLMILMLIRLGAQSQTLNLDVHVNKPGAEISATMWGLFFEDINLGADGGLYAELVKNRSFEFDMPMMGWKQERKKDSDATVLVINQGAQFANPRFARVDMRSAKGELLLINEGFRGMGINKDAQYDLTLLARTIQGQPPVIRVELQSPGGVKLAGGDISVDSKDWKKYTLSLTASATEEKAKLVIIFSGAGSADIDMISLFPRATWKDRPGGLRKDLVQMLADIKPGFLRFPGGCIVEGKILDNRYQWKKTVGNVEERETIINRWNTEFTHRSTPDYYQSFGLGFFEYFQLAEDIGAEPLPILNCGMACQFNSAEVVPLDQLDPYIQDALDLIEFANGDEQSKWGKLRISMGHPKPFNLKYLGVGNEQWGEQYIERFTLFAKTIKAKYPEIKLISSAGPGPEGAMFNYLNDTLRKMNADFIDEHYYRPPEWFLKNAKRYDHYDRKGPKVFAGEYAAHVKAAATSPDLNTWQAALAEAAFMTGLERNADVVQMASYAPLFAHAEGWQWTPDLIWFDNLRSYGTPNYFVQKLYGTNKGNRVVPVLLNNETLTGQRGLYASASIDQKTNELIIKLVNTTTTSENAVLNIRGAKKIGLKGTVTRMQSDNIHISNSFREPAAIAPSVNEIGLKGKAVNIEVPGLSFTVLRFGISQ